MATDDFFRARLDAMVELKHPLAVLSTRLPWPVLEAAVAPKLSRRALPAKQVRGKELLGAATTPSSAAASARRAARACPSA